MRLVPKGCAERKAKHLLETHEIKRLPHPPPPASTNDARRPATWGRGGRDRAGLRGGPGAGLPPPPRGPPPRPRPPRRRTVATPHGSSRGVEEPGRRGGVGVGRARGCRASRAVPRLPAHLRSSRARALVIPVEPRRPEPVPPAVPGDPCPAGQRRAAAGPVACRMESQQGPGFEATSLEPAAGRVRSHKPGTGCGTGSKPQATSSLLEPSVSVLEPSVQEPSVLPWPQAAQGACGRRLRARAAGGSGRVRQVAQAGPHPPRRPRPRAPGEALCR
jgi:hypothetical protein